MDGRAGVRRDHKKKKILERQRIGNCRCHDRPLPERTKKTVTERLYHLSMAVDGVEYFLQNDQTSEFIMGRASWLSREFFSVTSYKQPAQIKY